MQLAPQTVDKLQNAAGFGFHDRLHHQLAAAVQHGDHGRFLVHVHTEYRRRVDGVTRELNAAGIYVVWLGLPIPDGPGFKKSFPIVNAVLERVARAHPHSSVYVDTWHLLDDAHGRYTAYLRVHGHLTLMRLPDGVHYTSAAGDLIAQDVLAKLRAVYSFGG